MARFQFLPEELEEVLDWFPFRCVDVCTTHLFRQLAMPESVNVLVDLFYATMKCGTAEELG